MGEDCCKSRGFLVGGSDGVLERDLTFTIWSGSSLVLELSPDSEGRGGGRRRFTGVLLKIQIVCSNKPKKNLVTNAMMI